MNRISLITLGILLSASSVAPAGEQEVRAAISNAVPGGSSAIIVPAQIPGFQEVNVGGQLYYVSDDGVYLFTGHLIDMKTGTDLTEARMGSVRLAEINKISEAEMIIYEPPGEVRNTVTVFTDIDCGYCVKLHNQMDGYLSYGIRVRYLFYPRSGPGSPSADKAEAVWCAEDRQKALTASKNRQNVALNKCDNPVINHFSTGQRVGVRGTPAMVADDGEFIAGYLPPAQLAARLQ